MENGSCKSHVYLMWSSQGTVSLFFLCANFLLPLAYSHTRTLASLPFSQCSRCALVPVCPSHLLLLLECIGPVWSHSALVCLFYVFLHSVKPPLFIQQSVLFNCLSPSIRVRIQKGTEFVSSWCTLGNYSTTEHDILGPLNFFFCP